MSRWILLTILGLVSTTWQTVAQEQPAAGLSADEVTLLGKQLAAWRKLEAETPKTAKVAERLVEDRKKAAEVLKATLEKVRAAHAGKEILSFTDSWANVFAVAATETKSATAEGLGRARPEKFTQKIKGKDLTFDYAILLPAKYDGKKRWPLLVALHDKVQPPERETDGVKYLNEVWATSKDPVVKELRDQFIIICPTVGERLNAKKNEDKERIEWFDDHHYRILRLCMGEAVRNYNIDTDRIFAEGTGVGGTTALELAYNRPQLFAGVVARSALPATVNKLANLKNLGQVLFVDREGGVLSTDTGKLARQQIEQLASTHSVKVEFQVLPALADKGKMRQALGTQGVDPVHDATPVIAKWLTGIQRRTNPAETRYATSDLRRFRDGSWVSILVAEVDDGSTSVAVVEAIADRAKNTVTITTTNVETFKVLLNDRLVDLDQPVKFILNGKDFQERKFDRDVDQFITFANSFAPDPGVVINAELTITVPREAEKPAESGTGDGK